MQPWTVKVRRSEEQSHCRYDTKQGQRRRSRDIISGQVTSSSPSSRPGEYPASRQAVPGCRPDTAAGEEQKKIGYVPLPSKGRSRKFSGAGFTLGGRCGSLAVGASPVDAYTDGGRGMALKAGNHTGRAPTSSPRGKFPVESTSFTPHDP